jgi:chloramphenicol 3-O phosphotransferase
MTGSGHRRQGIDVIDKTRIILLNGVGSVGKTSLARALQSITAEPYLHIQMDAFIDMLPVHLQEHADGFSYVTEQVEEKPQVVITTGPVGARCLRGMRHAVAAMAAQGNNLIVDDVMLGEERAEYERLLAGFRVHWVGVFAPLDVLEARERDRGDRLIGLARWQFDRVHRGKRYDLEVDTSRFSPDAGARQIAAAFAV